MPKPLIRVGFAGSDVVAHAVLEVPTPPTGVFAALKPIDLSWFRAVDMRAVTASATNLRRGRGLYDTVMNIVKTAVRRMQAISSCERPSWTSKPTPSCGFARACSRPWPVRRFLHACRPARSRRRRAAVSSCVAKLKDAPLFEKTMSALGEFAAGQSKGSLQVSAADARGRSDRAGLDRRAAADDGIMPAWSIANDHVVIGSNVELCDLGVKQLAAKGADGQVDSWTREGYKKIAAGLPKS